MFIYYSREAISDFALYIVAHMLTELVCGDPVTGTDMDIIMSYFTYHTTWVDSMLSSSNAEVRQIEFGWGNTMPYSAEPSSTRYSLEQVHWLHFGEKQGVLRDVGAPLVCDDSDVLCSLGALLILFIIQ